MWILLSFLIAILESAKDLLGKSTSNKINPYVSAFCLQFFAVLTLLPIILITGIPKIQPVFWIASVFSLFSIPAWSLLYMRGVTLSPLYLSIPMMAFNPVFTTLLSIFFDHRFPDALGWMGIIFICVGLYLLRLKKEVTKKGVLYPILNIRNEPGAISMLGVALIWSLGVHVAKIQTLASSPLFFAFTVTVCGTVVLFFLAKIKAGMNFQMVKNYLLQLGLLGFLNGFAELVRGMALQIGYTPYVVAIARSNIIASSLGGKIFFKEKFSRINIAGLILMFAGIILIIAV